MPSLPWALLGLALAAAAFLVSQGLQPCDDAYITFRHARNLALDARPAWNLEGVPVLGSTSPGFVFALGGLALVFGAEQIESIALALNALAVFAIVVLSHRIARDLLAGELAALAAAALIGFNSVNVFVFSLGFEGALFTALLLATLDAVRTGRDGIAVGLASAAPLIRPEGILLTPLVWGYLLISRRIRRSLVAVYLPLPLLWLAFATAYYGSPVPHSIWAKRLGPAVYRPYEDAEVNLTERLVDLPEEVASIWTRQAEGMLFSSALLGGIGDLRHRALRWTALLGLPLLVLGLARRRDGRILHLLPPPAFLLLYGLIGHAEVWYFPAFVTTSVLVLFAGCHYTLLRLVGGLGPWARAAATLAVFALFASANDYALNRADRTDPGKGLVYAEDPRGRQWQSWERERFDGYRTAARFLNGDSARPGPALISEVGVFAYFYAGPVIDAIGLCSPEALAFYPPPPSDIYDSAGRYRTSANTITPTALVSALEPEYLISSATYIPHLLLPGVPFLDDYVVLADAGRAWGQPILVFRRSAPLRGEATGFPHAAWFEDAGEAAFSGHADPHWELPYDVVATDMDLDGDPDLLINWHHLQPLELFENRDGAFDRTNRIGADRSGLFENRGIPSLYAEADEIRARIRLTGEPGLYVWHDVDREGSWRFLWTDEARRLGGASAEIAANADLTEIEGLEPEEFEQSDARRLRAAIGSAGPERQFRVKVAEASTQLKLRLLPGPRGEPPPVFIGRELTRAPGGAFDVWMPDPHGVAWVDVEGTRHPDLYVTRGGIKGTLRPPLDPKVDRYYIHRGGGDPLYRMADPGTLAPGYGRGRRVEWVDVDLDGVLELSVTNFETPNGLLFRDPATGALRDRAAELGLDLGAHVGVWGDLDADGLPDFFYLEEGAIDVARNRGAAGFERVAGADLGLTLPGAGGVHEFTALHWADFDNDGELDLWVLAYADELTNHLFRRDGPAFVDVSERVGLSRIRGNSAVVLADFDNDSFVDVASFGGHRLDTAGPPRVTPSLLWRNRAGAGFDLASLGISQRHRVATGLDADGDGRTDLVLVGAQRRLLRNVTAAGGFLDVVLRDGGREPIGAIVRARYADGSTQVQRWGSAHNTAHSQTLQPLRFGIPSGVALREIAVRWPGEREDALHPVRETDTIAVLERRR